MKRLQGISLTFHRKHDMVYQLRPEGNYNLEKPFLWLAKILTGGQKLMFVNSPSLASPEVDIDIPLQQNDQELEATASQPPHDDGCPPFMLCIAGNRHIVEKCFVKGYLKLENKSAVAGITTYPFSQSYMYLT